MMLQGKRMIITGAGRGIGRVTAICCAKEGAHIALISRTQGELASTLVEVTKYSPRSFHIAADISIEDEINRALANAIHTLSGVDVLVNNAGIQTPIGPFHTNDLRKWKKNVEINVFGTAHCIYAVLPEMIKQGKGKIINLSGGGATSPRSNFSAYAVSKTAVVRFTETLAEELREFNIDINAIAPGAINTKMLDEIIEANELAGKELQEALKRKRSGGNDPQIVAELITFLASAHSDGITGKLISAPWDPWREEGFRDCLRCEKDVATIRRIDNKYFLRKT